MNRIGQPVSEDDLMAYVDDRLADDRLAAVERFLAENAIVRARVVADRAHRENLRQRLHPIADQPIPNRLRVETIMARRRETMRWRVRAAVAVRVADRRGRSGWEARDLMRPRMFTSQQAAVSVTAVDAMSAHRVFVVEKLHPVEVGVAQEAHLVQWLSRRVGHALAVPDLTEQGYALMGGRLLPAGNEAAAQFMYESGLGQRLTVYVRASGGSDTQFRFVQGPGVSAFSWIDQGLGFAIVGGMDRSQLLTIADNVYQQVDPQHRRAPAEL